jgi:hypothetical protein
VRNQPGLILMLLVAFSAAGCQSATPPPLPGWRTPVYGLLVDDSDLPPDWKVESPQATSTDPTANHVSRSWGHVAGSGGVAQSIWRAYTTAEAQAKYSELRRRQFKPSRTLEPGTVYTEFAPPPEINFQSPVADELYIACGWWDWAYCEVIARYRNYVVEIRADQKAELNGRQTDGLTYPELEMLVVNMDAKFTKFLEQLAAPATTP